jgi:hypothetical protein
MKLVDALLRTPSDLLARHKQLEKRPQFEINYALIEARIPQVLQLIGAAPPHTLVRQRVIQTETGMVVGLPEAFSEAVARGLLGIRRRGRSCEYWRTETPYEGEPV